MEKDSPETLGRYQLLAMLAKGGMAEIHLAKQQGIEGFARLVVIKRILPSLSGEKRFLEMFLDEARIAAQLNHQNIVQVHDLGEEDGEYYIAMEYLEGESLGYMVREAARVGENLPPELAAGIVGQVCDGLDYAHKQRDENGAPLNIVHRDVCPHNIIVLFSGVAKLVDFGIAKAASQMHITRVGTLKGKLAYMAPEQVLAKPVDARSDIFSLGAVFWELLCRRRLFKRDSEGAMVHAIVNDEAPPVRDLRSDVSVELQGIVARALHKEPDERFQTAGEMGREIREHLRMRGAAAGVHDISAFVDRVFAERARTKRRLLDEIRASGGKRITLGLLKPDTEESLPSHSGIVDSEVEEDDYGIPTQEMNDVDEQPTFKAPPPPGLAELHAPTRRVEMPVETARDGSPLAGRRFFPLGISIAAGLLLALVIWWAVPASEEPSGDDESSREPDAGILAAVSSGIQPAARLDAGKQAPKSVAESSPDAGIVAVQTASQAILDVRSKPPGCTATLDGVEVPGLTPVPNLSVDARVEHVITVSCPDHEPESKRFTLEPDQDTGLMFRPKPKTQPPRKLEFGLLSLNTKPWSVVYLGKKKLGLTPLMRLKLPAGKHKLTAVNQEQGLRKTIQVEILPGKTTKRLLKLDE